MKALTMFFSIFTVALSLATVVHAAPVTLNKTQFLIVTSGLDTVIEDFESFDINDSPIPCPPGGGPCCGPGRPVPPVTLANSIYMSVCPQIRSNDGNQTLFENDSDPVSGRVFSSFPTNTTCFGTDLTLDANQVLDITVIGGSGELNLRASFASLDHFFGVCDPQGLINVSFRNLGGDGYISPYGFDNVTTAIGDPILPFFYQDATSIADLDGNGFPEIAVLNTRDGHTYVTLKDSDDKTQVGRIYFFNDEWTPKAISTLSDMNGNGTDELAVLAVKKENGKVWVKVMDSETKEVLNWVYFVNRDWMAMGLTTVADLNNNGVDELAVLVVKKSTSKASTVIRDAETKEQLSWICY